MVDIRTSPSGPQFEVPEVPVTSSQVTNLSRVSGPDVTTALNALLDGVPIIDEPGAARVAVATDAGKLIRCTNAGGCVITFNVGIFKREDIVLIRQVGAALVSLAGTVAVTPPVTNVNTTAQQGGTIAVVFLSNSLAESMGDLSDA